MDPANEEFVAAILAPPVEPTLRSHHSESDLRSWVSRWWVAFTASAAFVVCGHLLIKAGLNTAAQRPAAAGLAGLLHLVMRPEVIIGLLVYCLGSICWVVAVAQQEISFLYPLSSLNYVLVVIGSSLLFHEAVSSRRASGLVLIVFGMVVMNRTRSISQ